MTNFAIANIDTVRMRIAGMNFNIPGAALSQIKKDRDQPVSNTRQLPVELAGKYGSHPLTISSPDSGNSLIIEGALAGFLFGQNVFTSHQLMPLVISCIKRVCQEFGWKPGRAQIERWKGGKDIVLERVDIAVNFRLGSERDVSVALTQIKRQAIEYNFGISGHGSTVYFRPNNGKSQSMKFYGKHAQLKRSSLGRKCPLHSKLETYCSGILRVELQLNTPALRASKLLNAYDWKDDSARAAFKMHFLEFRFLKITSGPICKDELAGLNPGLARFLVAHKLGADLSLIYDERSIQRNFAAFRELGIDLKCPNSAEGTVLNITKVLHPMKAETAPEWMRDAGIVMVATFSDL